MTKERNVEGDARQQKKTWMLVETRANRQTACKKINRRAEDRPTLLAHERGQLSGKGRDARSKKKGGELSAAKKQKTNRQKRHQSREAGRLSQGELRARPYSYSIAKAGS